MSEENIYCNVNKHLVHFESDYFYHLYLAKNADLKNLFGDIKFVCMGGQSKRMQRFANYMKDILGYKIPAGLALNDITQATDRYSMYKVGPVLFVNHGIGCPSLSILLHELLKLLLYAECKDVEFFRIGTCGGIGIEPGTVVISEEAVDGLFRPEHRQLILGKEVSRPTKCDADLLQQLLKLSQDTHDKSYEVVVGKTLCVNDFYEEQARLDGIFCSYTHEEKLEFLHKCKENNIKNIEMESLCFASFLNHAGIKFAIVCVALLDRLRGDQIVENLELLLDYQQRPFEIVGKYIQNCLAKK